MHSLARRQPLPDQPDRLRLATLRHRAGATADDPPRTFPYIQWQIIQSGTTRLFLAVDTSCGDPEVGYFCSPNSLTRDFLVNLQGMLDIDGKPLKGVPDIDLCIRPAAATAGDAKHVHMIIDFGNSRTGVLLLELAGEISQTPQMLPFELTNRYHLDAWNEEGEFVSQPAARWFSSKTHWCNTPYLPPLQQKKTDYHTVGDEDGKRGWFGRGGKSRQAKVEMVVTPPLVRRPLHGPHGPRGRRRGAGHAGRRRHPHRR